MDPLDNTHLDRKPGEFRVGDKVILTQSCGCRACAWACACNDLFISGIENQDAITLDSPSSPNLFSDVVWNLCNLKLAA